MSGYVTSARIVRVSPRLAQASKAADLADWRPAVTDEPSIVDAVVGPPAGPTLADRREAFRERWAQLTFFLFDGDSWRR